MLSDQTVFLVTQKNSETDLPTPEDFFPVRNGSAHQTDAPAARKCHPRSGGRRFPRKNYGYDSRGTVFQSEDRIRQRT